MTIHITRLTRLVTQFGSSSINAADVARRLSDISEEDRLLLREAADDVANDVVITAAREAEIRLVLSRIPPRYTPRRLMTRGANGFKHQQLQAMYLQETAHLTPRPRPAAWVASLTDATLAHGYFRWLCGENFQADAAHIVRAQTPISIAAVPAASTRFASASTSSILGQFIRSPEDARRVLSRMRSLFDPENIAMSRLAAGQITRGLFSILKGNVAENLGLPLVLAAFGEGSAFGRRLGDGARLVQDVEIRLPGGNWKLFSDGIIIEPSSTGLVWHGGIEVKSFSGGFDEAADQVTRRREVFRLETNFELRIPDRASIYDSHGNLTTWSGLSTYRFPPVAGSSVANGIATSEAGVRTLLIAPRGDALSRFDIADIGEGIDSTVFPVRLNVTSADLDFMTAQTLQALRNSSVSINSTNDAVRALVSSTGARSIIAAGE